MEKGAKSIAAVAGIGKSGEEVVAVPRKKTPFEVRDAPLSVLYPFLRRGKITIPGSSRCKLPQ